ncbi:MAG: hypothetical protein GY742_08155 [Hyphomicrobiales bacterium]|nr:hypothetical protein [Hyphomicrobiales bacterium]
MSDKTFGKSAGLTSWTAALLFLLLPVIVLATESIASDTKQTRSSAPKLVAQITVDQLRDDLLKRYCERLETGGFR